MGNKTSQNVKRGNESDSDSNDQDGSGITSGSRRQSRKVHITALITLFEKLELTADEGNAHPGELSRATFENAFHGPLHKFGKLMYQQMVTTSVATNRERITREQFVKAGTQILHLYEEKHLVKYYFHLFASGKECLTLDDAKQMFEIAFTLTLSLSKILYKEDERDAKLIKAMATGLFGINSELSLDKFSSWLQRSCPHMFNCVHNWVCNVMTGSTLPEEVEMARVPQLEGVVRGNISMAILWLLSIALPSVFIKQPEPHKPTSGGASAAYSSKGSVGATSDPLLTAMILLRKNARLPEVQRWKLLYNSDNHGMSINRFNHHVSSYNAPNVTFFSFEGRNLYCLAIDTGWREGPNKFGGKDCMLIQVLPVFRVVQAGPKMVQWCETSRDIPKGILIGCEGMSEVLKIPKDFDSVFHYGVACGLNRVEVWGCGTEEAFDSQTKQRKWEAAAVHREQSRKLRPFGETWNDTPDTQILQWGGVSVGEHSYNR